VAQLEAQVEQCRDEARELGHQVDALQVCLQMGGVEWRWAGAKGGRHVHALLFVWGGGLHP
jgi:hypothetical protein